jgi:transposase
MYTILLQQWYGVLTAADLAYWDRLLCLVRSIEEGIFQEDDPSPHITQASWAFLEEEEIELLPWPPGSPDLSPIEKVWDTWENSSTIYHVLQQLWEENFRVPWPRHGRLLLKSS